MCEIILIFCIPDYPNASFNVSDMHSICISCITFKDTQRIYKWTSMLVQDIHMAAYLLPTAYIQAVKCTPQLLHPLNPCASSCIFMHLPCICMPRPQPHPFPPFSKWYYSCRKPIFFSIDWITMYSHGSAMYPRASALYCLN